MDNGYNMTELQKAFEMIFAGISAEGKEKAPASSKPTTKKPVTSAANKKKATKVTKKPVAKKKSAT